MDLYTTKQIVAKIHFGDICNPPQELCQVSLEFRVQSWSGGEVAHGRLDDLVVEHITA